MSQVFAATLRAPELDEYLERHRAFWVWGEVSRPLQAAKWGQPLTTDPSEVGYELEPGMVWDALDAGLDKMERTFAEKGVLDGDLFRCAAVPGGPPWIPAILGCRIRVFPSSSTHWREILPGGWEQVKALDFSVGRGWRQVLVEGTRRVVDRFGDRYPIASLYERGPVDMLAHVLGDTEMCLHLVDEPDEARRVLAHMTDLWIDVARELESIIPKYRGGGFHPYGIWAPGSICGFAVDASNVFSPAMYRDFFLPCDRRIAGQFDHILMHTHSASAQHYPSWLTVPNLAIQIADDPVVSITWPDLLAACERIQGTGRPMMLLARGVHYEEALQRLSPRGLMMMGYTPY